MSLANALLNQCRKPAGRVGRLNLWWMNRRHSAVTDWGLKQVSIGDARMILDVGCGGGRTIHKLAAAARHATVYGVDFSEESVATSRRTNQRSIDTGRVDIRLASVSHLPFPDRMFDLVTAVETHYYWPDLSADICEILRVLKPGGALVIIAEAYKGGKYDKQLQRLAQLASFMNYALLSVTEHRDLFANGGFTDVQVVEDYDKGWLCAVGRKPNEAARRETAGAPT